MAMDAIDDPIGWELMIDANGHCLGYGTPYIAHETITIMMMRKIMLDDGKYFFIFE